MLKFLSKVILKILGWQLTIDLPENKKLILIGAPHTSNWDFPLALLAFWTIETPVYWVAKIQMFRGPLHYVFTALGGIPVDRSSANGFINQIADKFKQTDTMALAIAPEGTRAKTQYWKSGFYFIALEVSAPICLGYIDYKTKTLGFKSALYPTGDIDADMITIADHYQDIVGKHPENQGPIKIRK